MPIIYEKSLCKVFLSSCIDSVAGALALLVDRRGAPCVFSGRSGVDVLFPFHILFIMYTSVMYIYKSINVYIQSVCNSVYNVL